MTSFIVVAMLMVVVVLAAVYWPLLRGPRSATAATDTNVGIYRDQLSEVERDRASGLIDADEADGLRREIEKRVLQEASTAPPPPARRSVVLGTLASAVLVPVIAILLYVTLGTPGAINPPPPEPEAANGQVTPEKIAAMVEKLAARLRAKPDDPVGWSMLGRSYAALGRVKESVDAYGRALALRPDDPDLMAELADVRALADNRHFDAETRALLARALAKVPDHFKALALSGAAAFERNEYGTAAEFWQKAVAVLPADAPLRQELENAVAEARKRAGGSSPPAQAAAEAPARAGEAAGAGSAAASDAGAGAGSPGAAAQGGNAAQAQGGNGQAGSGQAATSPARVSGHVSLAPALAGRTAPDDWVFVFARAAEGPRMPLALLRRQVRDLPFDFILDESMAMAPGMSLGQFKTVVVTARISKSGQAIPQSGDLLGSSGPVQTGTSGIAIAIDRSIP